MADFNIAVKPLLKDEGGYVNDPNDPGGETKYGISKRQYPHLDIFNLTEAKAIEIYHSDYWQSGFETINAQEIVNKAFCVGVDIGMQNGITCLQRAVRAASGAILNCDGLLGPVTIAAINTCNAAILLAALKSELAGHYRAIDNPPKMKGWLNRAYA